MRRIHIILFLCAPLLTLAQNPFARVSLALKGSGIEEAARIVDSCRAKKYMNDSVLYYSGLVNLRLNNTRAARKDMKELLKANKGFAAYYLQGMVLAADEDYGQSVDAFNKALSIDSTNARAYYNRAVVLGMMDNYRLAIEDLDKCVKIDPSYTQAYYSKAYWYEVQGNLKEAVAAYEKTISLDPQYYDAYIGLAYCQRMQKDSNKACETIRRAIEAGSQIAVEIRENFCH